MKIIDVLCEVPGLNIEGEKNIFANGYKCNSYSLKNDIILAQWVSEACIKLVDLNGISRDDIGVIINSSIYSGGTTISEKLTWGPALSYELQKNLKANNAFVFDMYCEDWCTTLHIANDFLINSSCKYALVAYSEKASKYEVNSKNGFCLSDGVGVILIEKSSDLENKTEIFYYHLDSTIVKNAEIRFIPNKDINNNRIKFSVDWNYTNEAVNEINKKLSEIINQFSSYENLLVERWFSAQIDKNKEISPFNEPILGRFSLLWDIQNSLEKNKFNLAPSVFISFNPFTSRYSALKIY